MKPVRWGVLGISAHFINRVLTPVQEIPCMELIEMPRSRGNSLCCGGGGVWMETKSELRGARRKRKRQPGERRSSQHYLTSSILLGVYY